MEVTLRVLLVSNGFPPRHWAGTETYTAGVAQELEKRNYQVQVLCGGDWEKGSAYFNGYTDSHYHNIPVRRLNLNWMNASDPFLYLYNSPVIADYITTYLSEIQPDVVHVMSCERLSASVLKAIKVAGLPLILSLTDFWFLCPRINLLRSDGTNCDGQTAAWDCLECMLRHTKAYRWVRGILPDQTVPALLETISQYPLLTRQPGLRGMAGDMAARKAYLQQALTWPDYRLTASHFVHDVFINNGVATPIKVQAYGHDLAWLSSYHGKISSDVIRFGFIGQINHHKGVHLLLQAAEFLQETVGDKFSLSIYGNINKASNYSAKLRELGQQIKNIKYCGTYPHEQSSDVFSNLDILVVPSVWYDFPLIIYEAFATQTPVIATNLGGMAEAITHNVNGLLFKRNDIADLGRQMYRLIKEPRLLDQLKVGVPSVKTIDQEIDELELIYHQALAQKQSLAQ